MRDKVNSLFNEMINYDAYDWLQVGFIVLILRILPSIINLIYELIMKKVFKLERNKYIKGWKKINQTK